MIVSFADKIKECFTNFLTPIDVFENIKQYTIAKVNKVADILAERTL